MESQEPTRIVIEQEKDWIRVRQDLKSVVDSLVDEQVNQTGRNENLELRKQVTRRIQKIMEETFSLAVPNLQINGHNYEEYLEMTEPFDQALDSKMFGLNAQKVEWATNTAERRKGVPKAIRELERQLEEMRHGMEWYPADEEGDDGPEGKKAAEDEVEETGQFDVSSLSKRHFLLTAECFLPSVDPLPRRAEVLETYRSALSNLRVLRESLPVQISRAERAKAVKEELQSGPSS
ncbi:hypothetical protein QFC21_002639 [Naganishia friedmannii]|uniref:Uncharacterized protein n=1 Tax=Naganishia friedmannii TaxID=89922 RepID=A0ACC2VWP1_9TREE|nr:hypothetical protein QFC21_002639 [Naganishia friedmannii]